ncbi:hypothetical protein niasHT_017854 [Heterodera trifolii]|uniref:Effector protein n=1 Tax=Heterodera trifolii TaxID=157864 RepID=A0ABD2LLD9_9BILA
MKFGLFFLLICFFFEIFEVKPNLAELNEQNPPGFWTNFVQENGIGDGNGQIGQIAKEMDEDDPMIEQLSDESFYKAPPPSPAHPTFQKTFSKKYGNPTIAESKENALKIGPDLVAKIDKTIKEMYKEKGIKMPKSDQKMELKEIVKKMGAIILKNKNNANGEEEKQNLGEIVELWHLTKENDQFKEYMKKENDKANNRRKKRLDPASSFLVIWARSEEEKGKCC